MIHLIFHGVRKVPAGKYRGTTVRKIFVDVFNSMTSYDQYASFSSFEQHEKERSILNSQNKHWNNVCCNNKLIALQASAHDLPPKTEVKDDKRHMHVYMYTCTGIFVGSIDNQLDCEESFSQVCEVLTEEPAAIKWGAVKQLYGWIAADYTSWLAWMHSDSDCQRIMVNTATTWDMGPHPVSIIQVPA